MDPVILTLASTGAILSWVALGLLLVCLIYAGSRASKSGGTSTRSTRPLENGKSEPDESGIQFEQEGYTTSLDRLENATRVSYQLKQRSPAILIRPSSFVRAPRRFHNMTDISIGKPDFDEQFLVSSFPEKFAVQFCDEKTRTALLDVLDSLSSMFVFELGPTQGQLKIFRRFTGSRELGHFQTLAHTLADQFIRYAGFPARGVTILEETDDRVGCCLICGSQIIENQVDCKICGTPHHAECWNYFGSCSTFACTGEAHTLVHPSPDSE